MTSSGNMVGSNVAFGHMNIMVGGTVAYGHIRSAMVIGPQSFPNDSPLEISDEDAESDIPFGNMRSAMVNSGDIDLKMNAESDIPFGNMRSAMVNSRDIKSNMDSESDIPFGNTRSAIVEEDEHEVDPRDIKLNMDCAKRPELKHVRTAMVCSDENLDVGFEEPTGESDAPFSALRRWRSQTSQKSYESYRSQASVVKKTKTFTQRIGDRLRRLTKL